MLSEKQMENIQIIATTEHTMKLQYTMTAIICSLSKAGDCSSIYSPIFSSCSELEVLDFGIVNDLLCSESRCKSAKIDKSLN